MDLKKHVVTAWKLTLEFIVPLILMTLVMVVVSVVTIGILAPVTLAGYMQSLLSMVREGREPKIQDLFSQMSLFLPLLLFGLVAFIATSIGFMLLFIPGLLVVIALTYCCLYMLPLMTDKRLGLIEAIKESYRMAVRDGIGEHIVVAILFLGISGIGSSFILGSLFTQPLATIFLLSVYDEKTR
ncbi:MAG: hypothetical protein BA872_05460 [Desulfobacterales bacterium C00003060]|nr:MAG: hypothetical protein BA872_05460 [Desulfobacterales bacterium C00003060]OEU83458.1 MAG: hypothetical protein BA865_00205 [Desulfobacterales bacterium S5133MH4]